MKKNINVIFIALITAFLSACSAEKSNTVTSTSEDGAITIEVQGTRYSSLDPFVVEVKALFKGKEVSANVEIQADDLTEDNIEFYWENNRYCIVELKQRDGQVQRVPVKFEGM